MEARMKPAVRARWSRAVLVCGKCSRKLDGGFGPDGDQPLTKALRKRLGLKKGPKARAKTQGCEAAWKGERGEKPEARSGRTKPRSQRRASESRDDRERQTRTGRRGLRVPLTWAPA